MKITDNNILFVMFFIPFLFMQCFADWGKHGQAKRYPFNKNNDSNSLSLDTSGKYTDGTGTSNSSIPGLTADSLMKHNAVANTETASPESASTYIYDSQEKDTGNVKSSVYNFSITDLNGLTLDNAEPSANIKRFRGTVISGGDTVRFKVPVYGNISLENIEFSGIKYKEPENLIETGNLENPYSFASGLWTAISSLGGIITMAAVTKPAFSEESDRATLITMCISGYIVSGVGQYFGVSKMAKHFRWNNEFGNRLSLHD